MIDICIQCHNYQRRLTWELSSILQQKNFDLSKLNINIACLKNNGNPTTEDVVDLFKSNGLNIEYFYFDKEEFAKRGNVRNKQVSVTNSDWLFFADADHVYHYDFFNQLEKELNRSRLYTSCNKVHTNSEFTYNIVNAFEYPNIINNAFELSNSIPINENIKSRKVAAGCMQVVKRQDIIERNNGLYVSHAIDKHLFKKGQLARSDLLFRREIKLKNRFLNLPLQIHLQHNRDKEVGYHLEEQR
ncbi:MAG: glycosyltransferase [bacterium]